MKFTEDLKLLTNKTTDVNLERTKNKTTRHKSQNNFC